MIEVMNEKWAHTAYPVLDEIAKRWSSRAFNREPIEREKIYSILEAARWSASAFNEQPWKFIVIERTSKENFDSGIYALGDFNKSWAKNAGALIIGLAKTHYSHDGSENAYAYYDLGQAVANLSTQATALGLYLHQMAGFSAAKVRERFKIPDGYEPAVIVAVGYIGAPDELSDSLKKREEAVRERKPLEAIAEFL